MDWPYFQFFASEHHAIKKSHLVTDYGTALSPCHVPSLITTLCICKLYPGWGHWFYGVIFVWLFYMPLEQFDVLIKLWLLCSALPTLNTFSCILWWFFLPFCKSCVETQDTKYTIYTVVHIIHWTYLVTCSYGHLCPKITGLTETVLNFAWDLWSLSGSEETEGTVHGCRFCILDLII